MSDDTKTVKDHMVGALGGAFKGISNDLKDLVENEDGMIVEGLSKAGLAALPLAAQGLGGVAAVSVPAVATALLPAVAVVGVGAGVGLVFAAGKGIGNYLKANQKRKS
jgi:hypothetical protein